MQVGNLDLDLGVTLFFIVAEVANFFDLTFLIFKEFLGFI